MFFLACGAEEGVRFPGGFARGLEGLGARNGPLGEREQRGAHDRSDGALGARVEFADGFDGVAEEFDAHGALRFGGEEIDDAAAHCELAGEFDHFCAGVTDSGEVAD